MKTTYQTLIDYDACPGYPGSTPFVPYAVEDIVVSPAWSVCRHARGSWGRCRRFARLSRLRLSLASVGACPWRLRVVRGALAGLAVNLVVAVLLAMGVGR